MQRHLPRDTRKGFLDSRLRFGPRGQRPGTVRGARGRARHLQVVRNGGELHTGQVFEAAARRSSHPDPPDGDGLPCRRGTLVASSLRVQAAGHAGDDGAEPAVEEREHQGEVGGDNGDEALADGPGAAKKFTPVDMLGSCQPRRTREKSINTKVMGKREVGCKRPCQVWKRTSRVSTERRIAAIATKTPHPNKHIRPVFLTTGNEVRKNMETGINIR